MKPKFLITGLSEKDFYCQVPTNKSPGNIEPCLLFTYEISIEAIGSFTNYFDDGVINRRKIALDIINGEIELVGLKSE